MIISQNSTQNETVKKSYHFNLNMNSGREIWYRGKFFDGNTGKDIPDASKINVKVKTPFFKTCPTIHVSPDSNGIF